MADTVESGDEQGRKRPSENAGGRRKYNQVNNNFRKCRVLCIDKNYGT